VSHIYTGTAPTETLNASGIAKAIGVTHKTVIALYEKGIIPAEIAEGRLYRFDLAKVRKALADRAAAKTTA